MSLAEKLKNSLQIEKPDVEQQYLQGRPISTPDLKGLGVDIKNGLKKVKDLNELEQYTPNIVIGQAFRHVHFMQNNSRMQQLKKKGNYVMGLGTYQQIHCDARAPKRIKYLKPSPMKFKGFYKKYNGEDLSDKTLLVWRTGGIGDLLFIQPNLLYLKEKYPTCYIMFACGPQYQSMLDNWDCIDEVLDLPFPAHKLREADYHVIFEGVIERTYEGESTNAYHLFTRWMGLNLPDEKLTPVQEVKEDKFEDAKDVLREWNLEGNDFVLMQLKASSPIRTPSNKVWKRVAEALIELGHKIVITDAPHNNDYIEKFLKDLGDKVEGNIFNFAPHSDSLDCTIALTKLSKLVVATDSAMVHIAASLSVPTFGLYGPFPGAIRLTTYENCDWIDCKTHCSPCYQHGHTPCKNSTGGHSNCYETLDIDLFKDKVNKLIGE